MSLYPVFDPTGSLLASGIQTLDSHTVRVQSANPSNSSLTKALQLDKGYRLSSLSWGYLNLAVSKTSKRPKLDVSVSLENEILFIGTNKGEILIYSPFSNEIITKLINPSHSLITCFHYSAITSTGWAVDINGNVMEWDLVSFKLIQNFQINEDSEIRKITTIELDGKPHLLVSSNMVYLLDVSNVQETVASFPGHISSIHTILPVGDDHFLTSAEGDRFINLYCLSKRSTQAVLVAQSDVNSISFGYGQDSSVLTAITEDGKVEVFFNPLTNENVSNGSSPSKTKKRRNVAIQSRSSNCTVKLSRPANDNVQASLNVDCAIIDSTQIIISWLEDASIPFFDRISWVNSEKELAIHGDINLIKPRPDLRITDHSLFGHDIAAPKSYNEGNAIVLDGSNFKDLDNDVNVGEDEEEQTETLADKLAKLNVVNDSSKKTKKKFSGAASTGTLTIMLSQALKANDHSLLETVLSNRDEKMIRATIQRLDSSLAVILLERLAEKVARQPARQGQLNIWIKWIMIIHGGYLVSLPNLSNILSSSHSTLAKRASTLPRLMELHGRLDMIHNSLELKHDITNSYDLYQEDDDESDVEYNEELDDAADAHLIDDVSDEMVDDYEELSGDEDEEDEEEDDEISIDESEAEEIEETNGGVRSLLDLEAEEDDEDANGYSDEEVGITQQQEEDEEDEEESRLKEKIRKMRAARK